MRLTISGRISAIVGLVFVGMIGLAGLQVVNQAAALREQRQGELRHLAEAALTIIKQEHDRPGVPVAQARQAAAERIAALRYGSGDYFWINDLEPRMVMHPLRQDLNGQPLGGIKDPTGKHLFVEFAEVVKKSGSGYVDYLWPKPGKDAPQPKLS